MVMNHYDAMARWQQLPIMVANALAIPFLFLCLVLFALIFQVRRLGGLFRHVPVRECVILPALVLILALLGIVLALFRSVLEWIIFSAKWEFLPFVDGEVSVLRSLAIWLVRHMPSFPLSTPFDERRSILAIDTNVMRGIGDRFGRARGSQPNGPEKLPRKLMYSLKITCSEKDVDPLISELWEVGTAGIREIDQIDGSILLIAGFGEDKVGDLLPRFREYRPEWYEEPEIDWVEHTKKSWPGREVGKKLYLAPPWSATETPSGRLRLIHTPGSVCGTGEHPCTRLAMEALENCVQSGATIADIGAGSGNSYHRCYAAWGVNRDCARYR